MPVQHSSDRLLRAMRRGRDSRFLRELLAQLRARVPGIALRTSLIVGLPGETEEDFRELLRFVREQRFERLGVFTYSQEEGTSAARMSGQVPETVKKLRFAQLMELQREIAREQQRALIGRRLEVLVEGAAEESEHLLAGRHSQQAPEIDGLTYLNEIDLSDPHQKTVPSPGELVVAEITAADDYDLVGTVVERVSGDQPLSASRRPGAASRRRALRILS